MKIFINGLDGLINLVNDEVSWMFGDVEEIGSSDINACANNVLSAYYEHASEASDSEFQLVRNAVRNSIGEMFV